MEIEKAKKFLFDKKEVTLPELQLQFGLSYYAASNLAKALEEKGLIKYDKEWSYKVTLKASTGKTKNCVANEYDRAIEERRSYLEKKRQELLKRMRADLKEDEEDNEDDN